MAKHATKQSKKEKKRKLTKKEKSSSSKADKKSKKKKKEKKRKEEESDYSESESSSSEDLSKDGRRAIAGLKSLKDLKIDPDVTMLAEVQPRQFVYAVVGLHDLLSAENLLALGGLLASKQAVKNAPIFAFKGNDKETIQKKHDATMAQGEVDASWTTRMVAFTSKVYPSIKLMSIPHDRTLDSVRKVISKKAPPHRSKRRMLNRSLLRFKAEANIAFQEKMGVTKPVAKGTDTQDDEDEESDDAAAESEEEESGEEDSEEEEEDAEDDDADEKERDKKGKSGEKRRANIKQATAVEKAKTAASAKNIENASPMKKRNDAPSSAASPSASPQSKSNASGIFPQGYSRNSAASIASDMTKDSADIENTNAHLDVKEFVQGCAGIRANQNLQTCIC